MVIVFDDTTAVMEANEKFTELSLRGTKLNISIVFLAQSYLNVPKTIRLNTTHYFIIKIVNEKELQQIELNYLSDIGFKNFIKLYKDYTKEPF